MMKHQDYRQSVQKDNDRHERAKRQKNGLFGLLLYGGTLGLLLVVPMVAGAYLGRWLDAMSPVFQTRWTVSLILLGIALGVWNVIWYLRQHP
ncbi:AtpZ/AtpI family protein [Shewanella sp. AS16]|uniref:AtpZ/AtpI family protein n=1 Tax=Shewanella sp. AS16 TaxID=2907625 RepID=UPI001F310430|nr:AtpZ/AtpI family protein [Shewanella sp. AS16]MCE9684802.1 AtpZ/AtpI family protein [Shewanella sp. AS16]